MKRSISIFSIGIISYACLSYTFAAKPIDLNHQDISILQSWMTKPSISAVGSKNISSIEELNSDFDINQTKHIRIRETFAGHPVWGTDTIVHVPRNQNKTLKALTINTSKDISMTGVFYQGLNEDLANSKISFFDKTAHDRALQHIIKLYQSTNTETVNASKAKSKLIVYVDQNNKAHWSYLISFFAKPKNRMPALPTYIIDANSYEIYKQWNDLKTLENVLGGGIGGNEGNLDEIFYDGLSLNHHLSKLDFQRDNKKKLCYLQNDLTIIKDVRKNEEIPSFSCNTLDDAHNHVYWNTLKDQANGGYSPANDALYSDKVVRKMYKDWFSINMLEQDGKPMQVVMHVHDPDLEQNAYYTDGEMVFGDGDKESYPLTIPGVVAHEMSHGFTEQHSNLNYEGQSGALNESFSDAADKAVQYFLLGKNDWIIDQEIVKAGGKPIRYMDQPEKDGLSISHTANYNKLATFCRKHTKEEDEKQSCIVHLASGVFNKIFYLIATEWNNTQKAFEIMTQANRFYWTANTNFQQAACGLIKATKDYKYDVKTVKNAMAQVGLDSKNC